MGRADGSLGVLQSVVCLTVLDLQTSTVWRPMARAGLLRRVTGQRLWLYRYVCYLTMLSTAVTWLGDDA